MIEPTAGRFGRESEVRTYSRAFPTVFEKASGAFLYDESGKRYLDFFSGAGTINYGHNNKRMRRAIISYIENDGIVHSLDMATTSRQRFMDRFAGSILAPRGLDYTMQFTGPGGTNAIETALKLARLNTGRSHVAAFTNAYHGLSLGALALTGNAHYRNEAFVDRSNASFLPYDGYLGAQVDTTAYIRKLLEDAGSGFDLPAAIVVETIQAEGGVLTASVEWLQQLETLCRDFGILLIVDDIQVGCGRTGSFFSFEAAGIQPDIVVLSKALSGFGLPMSMVLMRPSLDRWKPGEDTGTFRGHNLAFVAGAEAVGYWETEDLARQIASKHELVTQRLGALCADYSEGTMRVRGRGLIHGIEMTSAETARCVAEGAFAEGLIIERCGPSNSVLKLLPPLTIEESELSDGLTLLEASLRSTLAGNGSA